MASWVLEELEVRLSAKLAAGSWLLVREAAAPLSKGAGVNRRFEGGSKVCHLGIRPVVDALVDLVDVGCTVVSRCRGAARHHLVEAAYLDVALAEERYEVVEIVVRRARAPLHNLILKILLLFDL